MDIINTSGSCCIPDRQGSNHSAGQCSQPVKPSRERLAAIVETVSLGNDWFRMGCDSSPHPEDGEGPSREVWVDQFRMAVTAVSNCEFQRFVDATGYVTDAEREGSSFVFYLQLQHDALATATATATASTSAPAPALASASASASALASASASAVAPWWRNVADACWHQPEGTGSSIAARCDHPVVHISRNDALQYCRWSDTRLATEAEWEYAARGALVSQPYPWGAELHPNGDHRCNIWQGEFPQTNLGLDGFAGTAPVQQYAANGHGLYNMTGNVWEWVADRFTNMHSPRQARNPKGPLNGDQFVAKGGSYLCHESYCLRYRTSSRQALLANVSAANLGFRVAADMPTQDIASHCL